MTENEKELEKEFEKQIGIGKTKVGLIICIILVVMLAFSNAWFFTKFGTLQSQVNSLQTDKNQLESQVNSLQSQIDSLISEYNNYVASHHYTDKEYARAALFSLYYVEPKQQKFGVYDLEDELYDLEWPYPYEEGVFDCSEMSAYLEWCLENEGRHTIIVLGDTPFDSGYHAWLLVETSIDHYMPVESTKIEIVWWDDPYFDNYFIYDYEFETIQEAMTYDESEFDWWE